MGDGPALGRDHPYFFDRFLMVYNPRSFRVDDLPTLHRLIRDFPFGVLFNQNDEGPIASHLPFMVDPDRGQNGTLVAHMARANPQWKRWTETTTVLAVFQGPHAYISPAWYEDQVTVPTWNYATVHVTGRPEVVIEPERLRSMVERLLLLHESGVVPGTSAAPHGPDGRHWDPSLIEAVMDAELEAIAGFEIPIDRIEGKFKFNQNRSREDQAGVARALSESDDPAMQDVARIMKDNLDD
ncbi:MAG: FMN-binding negative transcriptional regulator [Gemmatimonadota bacterium]